MPEDFRCGLAAVVGRPNVGKSTLVNRLVARKISITSHRPQTTRARILGIKTDEHAQIVYVDTPGLHEGAKSMLGRYMNRAARGSLEGVDCVVWLIAADGWTAADEHVMNLVRGQPSPVILVINKMDKLKDRAQLLPLIKDVSERMNFAEIIPVCALTGENVDDLECAILSQLPQQPPLFPEGQTTNRDERFVAAELVREQVFRDLREEVPYAVAVGVEGFERAHKVLHINAVIWVEREGQKAIIIGQRGERLKTIGQRARHEMETLFGCKVYLELWVKVRQGWADSEALLRSLQYGDE
ncbi:MAG: GTPase Era [Acidiferrobacterales bacterium]